MSDKDASKITAPKVPGEVVKQEPGKDPTNMGGTAVKAPDKVGNMATPEADKVPLITPKIVGGLKRAEDLDALVFRGTATDQTPDAGVGPTEESQTKQLRSNETGKGPADGPVARQWQSDLPSNPNQILLNEAPKPDVVGGGTEG